jgi:cyanophycinase-like exopeptidase
MRNYFNLIVLTCLSHLIFAQDYTSYRVGNPTSTTTTPSGGICLMGGASENDEGMKWFLQKANGGDVLILRTSGSDGYNDYFYSDLGVSINSVETIVCHTLAASEDPYVWNRINEAEAIWFAGGDQWQYISFWRDSPIDSLINKSIQERSIVIGGTSAGMAIQGQYYFSAQNGTITSAQALNNPYNSNLTISNLPFIKNDILETTITDTHFDNPDRKGRLTAFLARMYVDFDIRGKAIACDEYSAVCIDQNGIARVFGDYPTYDDQAYFIQTNCAIHDLAPETILSGTSLTWNKNGEALLAYNIKGTSLGTNRFNLNDWETASGGNWEKWSVVNGQFQSAPALPPNCETLTIETPSNLFSLFSDETTIHIYFEEAFSGLIKLHNINGQIVEQQSVKNCLSYSFDQTKLATGLYVFSFENNKISTVKKWIIIR